MATQKFERSAPNCEMETLCGSGRKVGAEEGACVPEKSFNRSSAAWSIA